MYNPNATTENGIAITAAVPDQEYRYSITGLQNTGNFRPGAPRHVLMGELNSRGRAVGYHYEGINGSTGNIIPGTKTGPNQYGVYEARVQVSGVNKTGNGGISTFWPQTMTPQQIIDSTNQAYANKVFLAGSNNTYIGIAANGMEVTMYIDSAGKIISFFPVY